jgi:hypothetical protein
MSSGDCKSQTTNTYNRSKPHTITEATVSSSVSRYTHHFSNRTQNQHSTEALTTVNTGMYYYTLIICHTWLYIWVTLQVSYEKQEQLTFRKYLSSPPGFCGVRVAHLFSFCVILLCVFTLRFPHTNYVRFVYFQLFLVVRMSYLRYLCLLIVVCTTYCIFFRLVHSPSPQQLTESD